MNTPRPPVIIIGMHRSGTSVLTRVLQRLGFFMGIGASRNEEAAFTNALNAWIFRHASATWDRPESVDWLLQDLTLGSSIQDYVAGVVDGPASIRFLGLRRFLACRGMSGIAEPWGWKDPRNTYTLPFWLEQFPEARVLHIIRHGVDVAASLRARRAGELQRNLARYRRWRAIYRSHPAAPKRRPFAGHQRCAGLAGGFSLWESYVDRAREHVRSLGPRAMEVRYESLLSEPEATIAQALEFCGVAAPHERMQDAIDDVNAGRAYAFAEDPECTEFARAVEDRLRRHDYGPGT